MTTDQMKYFLCAAEQLSFTAAAERLYITQPSLSRQIAAIEKELEVQLFIRSNNTVRLTPAGTALYKGLIELYPTYLNMVEEVKDVSSGIIGRLTIALLEDQVLDNVLVLAMGTLLKKYPNIDINISRRDFLSLYNGLIDGSIDIAVTLLYDEEPPSGMKSKQLSVQHFYLAVSKNHSAAGQKKINYHGIARITETLPLMMVALESFAPPMRQTLSNYIDSSKFVKKLPMRLVQAVSYLPLYVSAGLGITIVNQDNILSIDPNVRLIKIEDGDTIRKGLLWKESNVNPIINMIISDVENELKKLSLT
ncbi:MAG: hypothetical protein H6Q74_1395 [Firmicutes bacterium]|nr:hypothetical protein [Bacillota bacterium]